MPATIRLMIATVTKTCLMRQQNDTISIQFSGQLVRLLHWILRTVDPLFAVLVSWDGFLSFSRLFVQSLFDSDGFCVVFPLIHRTVFTLAVEYQCPTVSRLSCSSAVHICMIFWNFVVVCGEGFVPPSRELWLSVNWPILKSCQHGVISVFISLSSRSVSCVINSLFVSVPTTRAVSWTFLYHVFWNW